MLSRSNLLSCDLTLVFQIINTLILIGIPVVIIFLIMSHRKKTRRMNELEARLSSIEEKQSD